MYSRRGLGQVDCSAGAGSACDWTDDIWASQGCLNWYAQCDPTNPFYLTNTKGLIVGGSQVIGSTVGGAAAAAAGGAADSLLGLTPGTIPGWLPIAGIGLAALLFLPALLKAIK
jgi:hypothetical protein